MAHLFAKHSGCGLRHCALYLPPLTTGARYGLNYFCVVAFGRPLTRVSRDIRPA